MLYHDRDFCLRYPGSLNSPQGSLRRSKKRVPRPEQFLRPGRDENDAAVQRTGNSEGKAAGNVRLDGVCQDIAAWHQRGRRSRRSRL